MSHLNYATKPSLATFCHKMLPKLWTGTNSMAEQHCPLPLLSLTYIHTHTHIHTVLEQAKRSVHICGTRCRRSLLAARCSLLTANCQLRLLGVPANSLLLTAARFFLGDCVALAVAAAAAATVSVAVAVQRLLVTAICVTRCCGNRMPTSDGRGRVYRTNLENFLGSSSSASDLQWMLQHQTKHTYEHICNIEYLKHYFVRYVKQSAFKRTNIQTLVWIELGVLLVQQCRKIFKYQKCDFLLHIVTICFVEVF